MSVNRINTELKEHLVNAIIPFWGGLLDKENGGFYGRVSFELEVDKTAPKSALLHSRILWFYSSCYNTLGDDEFLDKARHSFLFLVDKLYDKKNGGLFWGSDFRGNVINPLKHIFTNAFFIYALSAFYEATGDESVIKLAMDTFELIEKRMRDEKISYNEAFDENFNLCENDELSENGIAAKKTMNAVLHLIEAYTALYRAKKSSLVLERLEYLLKLTLDKIYDREGNKLFVFFDDDMGVLGDVHSYGHDIEASWLIEVAVSVCEGKLSPSLCDGLRKMNKALVERVYAVAFDDIQSGNPIAMNYERVGSDINRRKIWWAQAEAVMGFMNAYKLYRNERYLNLSNRIWGFIKLYFIDNRPNGEWLNELCEDNTIDKTMDIVNEWKCPYHNGRMCLSLGFNF